MHLLNSSDSLSLFRPTAYNSYFISPNSPPIPTSRHVACTPLSLSPCRKKYFPATSSAAAFIFGQIFSFLRNNLAKVLCNPKYFHLNDLHMFLLLAFQGRLLGSVNVEVECTFQ